MPHCNALECFYPLNNHERLFSKWGNIELDVLRMFQAVVSHGGVARAAQAPCTASLQPDDAHQAVGRAPRGGPLRPPRPRPALTAEGRVLLSYAERLLRLADEAESAVRSGRPLGTFRLGSLENAPPAPACRRFFRAITKPIRRSGSNWSPAPRGAHRPPAHPRHRSGLRLGTLHRAGPRQPGRVRGGTRPHQPPRSAPIAAAGDLGRTTLIAFANGCSYRKRLEDWLGAANVLPERVLEFASYPPSSPASPPAPASPSFPARCWPNCTPPPPSRPTNCRPPALQPHPPGLAPATGNPSPCKPAGACCRSSAPTGPATAPKHWPQRPETTTAAPCKSQREAGFPKIWWCLVLLPNYALLGLMSTAAVICAPSAVKPQAGDAPRATAYPAGYRRSHRCKPCAP